MLHLLHPQHRLLSPPVAPLRPTRASRAASQLACSLVQSASSPLWLFEPLNALSQLQLLVLPPYCCKQSCTHPSASFSVARRASPLQGLAGVSFVFHYRASGALRICSALAMSPSVKHLPVFRVVTSYVSCTCTSTAPADPTSFSSCLLPTSVRRGQVRLSELGNAKHTVDETSSLSL